VFIQNSANDSELSKAITRRISNPCNSQTLSMASLTSREAIWRIEVIVKPLEHANELVMQVSRKFA
jgi:hypothetical protein